MFTHLPILVYGNSELCTVQVRRYTLNKHRKSEVEGRNDGLTTFYFFYILDTNIYNLFFSSNKSDEIQYKFTYITGII